MPYSAELLFIGIHADQGIKEGVEFIERIVFGPHDPSHSLDFLSSWVEMNTHLNTNISTR